MIVPNRSTTPRVAIEMLTIGDLDALNDAADVLLEAEIHVRAWDRFVIEREESELGNFERIRGLPSDARMRVSLVRAAERSGKVWTVLVAKAGRRPRRGRRLRDTP